MSCSSKGNNAPKRSQYFGKMFQFLGFHEPPISDPMVSFTFGAIFIVLAYFVDYKYKQMKQQKKRLLKAQKKIRRQNLNAVLAEQQKIKKSISTKIKRQQ